MYRRTEAGLNEIGFRHLIKSAMKKTIEKIKSNDQGSIFCAYWKQASVVLGIIASSSNNVIIRIAANILIKAGDTIHDAICSN